MSLLHLGFLALSLGGRVAATSCTDSDTKIWGTSGSGGGLDKFQNDMTSCGRKCLGKESCVTTCIEGLEHYSDACSGCFGSLAECTKDHCMLKCMSGRTPACVSCVEAAGCDKTWKTCTGFALPSLPLAVKVETASCSDADSKIWGTKGSGGGLDKFQNDMTSCGRKCLGKESCVTTCVEGLEHYSDACSGCFGALAECTKDHCMLKCMSGRTPACVSCVEAAGCDKTWKTCTGFTPPSLALTTEVETASCSDADTKIWGTKGSGGGLDKFQNDMTSCGRKCLGKESCVTTCVEGLEHYSDACSGCFGALAECTKDHCMLKCMSGRTPACVSCVEAAGCDKTWKSCTGFTPPSSVEVITEIVV